jgi:hypothetical protein
VPSTFPLEPCFSLVPQRENKHGIDVDNISIERNVRARSASYQQLPMARFDRTTYQGAVSQDLHRLHDLAKPLRDIDLLESRKVIDEPVEVIENFWSEFNLRHLPISARAFARWA